MGSGGNAAGSGATQAGAVACTYGPQFIEASRPERRAARGPSTGSGAAALPVQHQEVVTESNEPSRGTVPAVSWEAVSERMESLVALSRRRHVYAAKCPSTRHYLRATSDNRRSARWPRRCRARRLPHRSAHYVATTAGDPGRPDGVPGCRPSMTGTARTREVRPQRMGLRQTGWRSRV